MPRRTWTLLANSILFVVGCQGAEIDNPDSDAPDAELRATKNRCGDGRCGASETCSSCATDCGSCAAPDLAPPAPAPTTTVLDGSGIPGILDTSCTLASGTDFIDVSNWARRRLQPRDCGIVRTSTPNFSWTAVTDRNTAVPWTFTLTKAGAPVASLTSATPWLLLSSPALTPGTYAWTVSYTTTGNVVRTSDVRHFVIPIDGAIDPIPSGQAFVERVTARSRPRILPDGSSFAAIATIAKNGEYSAGYTALMNGAATAKTQALPPPPPDDLRALYPSDYEFYKAGMALRAETMVERAAIEKLALAGFFTGDSSYTTAGIARLMNIASWSPTGSTSQTSQDQANRELFLALAEGLDLYAGALSSTQIDSIVVPLKARLAQVNLASMDSYMYDSHGTTVVLYITQALMHAVGTPGFPEANAMLASAWERFINMTNTFRTDDGGFGNGVGYGWMAMTVLPSGMAAVQVMSGFDLNTQPSVKNFGGYLIAMTPANQKQMAAFGDGTETNDYYFNYSWDAFRLYASMTASAAHQWYLRVRPQNLTTSAYPGIWQYMTLGLNKTLPAAVAPVANSWVFEDTGVTAVHSSTADSLRSSVFFRSSRFGSFNHSHADQNAFTFDSHGENVLISGGYYPYYYSPHHANDTRATRYKNALTFDGGIGQAEPVSAPSAPGAPYDSMDTRGKLINFYDDSVWAVSTGDATLAYRGRNPSTGAWSPLLTNAIRTVAYNRVEKVVVVYDWATSATARRWELNYNSLTPFSVLAPSQAKTVTASGAASACIDTYAVSGAFGTTSGFDVLPENGAPTQYQARFTASVATPQLVGVTIIREDCRSMTNTVDVSGTKATIQINNGAPLVFDQKSVTVPN